MLERPGVVRQSRYIRTFFPGFEEQGFFAGAGEDKVDLPAGHGFKSLE